jgi:alpha-L-arabinofuranosidase
MLSQARNDVLLTSTFHHGSAGGIARGTAGLRGSSLVLKLVNYASAPETVAVSISGLNVASSGTATVLANADANAQNTLDDPHHVVPSQTAVSTGAQFQLGLEPWSVTVLEIPVRS